MLWIERNDDVFDNVRWRPDKLLQRIWLGMIDYGQVDWEKVCRTHSLSRPKGEIAHSWFTHRWAHHELFAAMVDGSPRWALSGPRAGFVFQLP